MTVSSGRAIRVLIVDDEIDFAETLAKRLGSRGLAVEAVFDGGSALRRIETLQGGFDVVLLDCNMPDMSGIAVLQRIRESFPAVQVVIITGYGKASLGLDGMRLGAVDFITKPIDFDSLMTVVQAAAEGIDRI